MTARTRVITRMRALTRWVQHQELQTKTVQELFGLLAAAALVCCNQAYGQDLSVKSSERPAPGREPEPPKGFQVAPATRPAAVAPWHGMTVTS